MRSIQEKKKDGYKGEAHCDSSKLREKEGGCLRVVRWNVNMLHLKHKCNMVQKVDQAFKFQREREKNEKFFYRVNRTNIYSTIYLV